MDKKALLFAVGLGLGVLGVSSLPSLLHRWGKDTKPVEQSPKVNNTRYIESASYTHYSHDSDKGLLDLVVHRTGIDPNSTIRVIHDGGKYGVNDGLVDYIAISDPEQYLSRGQDYEEFEKADKLLAEIKKRAKESGYPLEESQEDVSIIKGWDGKEGFHNAIENWCYLNYPEQYKKVREEIRRKIDK